MIQLVWRHGWARRRAVILRRRCGPRGGAVACRACFVWFCGPDVSSYELCVSFSHERWSGVVWLLEIMPGGVACRSTGRIQWMEDPVVDGDDFSSKCATHYYPVAIGTMSTLPCTLYAFTCKCAEWCVHCLFLQHSARSVSPRRPSQLCT